MRQEVACFLPQEVKATAQAPRRQAGGGGAVWTLPPPALPRLSLQDPPTGRVWGSPPTPAWALDSQVTSTLHTGLALDPQPWPWTLSPFLSSCDLGLASPRPPPLGSWLLGHFGVEGEAARVRSARWQPGPGGVGVGGRRERALRVQGLGRGWGQPMSPLPGGSLGLGVVGSGGASPACPRARPAGSLLREAPTLPLP